MPLPCEAASWPGFERGMGIGGWLTNYKRFNVLPENRRLDITHGDLEHFDSYITEADVARIKGWGFDHIRLGFDQIVLEESPGKYRERTFRKIDEFIGWCGKYKMNVVLNMHKAVGNYCDIKENVELLDDDGLQRRFIDLWLEIERRYHDFSGLAFEILNEVRDVNPGKWNDLADCTVKAIRERNPDRWVVIGSTCWNSPGKLKDLKVWDDPKVVYTFHMYAPFEFTHQRGVLQHEPLYCNMVLEYPSADVERYRTCRRLGWYAENPYPNAKAIDKAFLAENLRGAFEFAKAHPDKILWNGEFGTIRHAPPASRVAYMRDVVSLCREHGIPYCVWNYLSTPNDGNRFSLVDDDTREFLSQELLNACLGTSRMSATGDYRLPEDVYVVSEVPGYNSWPMIQAVGNRLICSYSRDNASPKDGHKINRGSRDSYLRISLDAGRTWSDEITVADDPIIGEVNEGIGLDETGAAILWVRCWGKDRRHELYRTVDGQTIEKIATVRPDPFPMQIMDPVRVKGLGLVSPWFAGSYRNGGSNSWGLLVSTDNGRTWTQRIIEKDLSVKEWVTEPSLVDLGGGRLLIVGRCEKRLGNQFQVTSTDGGKTWKKARTNISDVKESTPSLVYDAKSGIVANYYYHRGAKQLKRRVAMADFIFDHPDCWPEPEVLDEGFEQRSYDAGNVKATRLGDRDCCAWYTGTQSNATVVVTVAASAVKAKTGACPGFEHCMGIGGKEDGLNFQGLIDEAAAHGGGRVVVPAGRHETGPLHLKSNVELHLEDGAELLFTDDIGAYLPAVETSREGVECLSYSPLIYANGVTNIAITGHGTLRPRMGLWECWQWGGSSAKLARDTLFGTWGENDVSLDLRDLTKLPDSKARPQFIGLRRCRGVRLENFRIRHSPFWCVHLLECDGVEVRRVDIEAYMHNNDGIDIESSRNILVEDSRFSVGDDVVCLKSGRDRDGRRRAIPTENVVVRRCVADCGHAFFGIGSELSGGIRNAVMEDCVMEGTCAWLFRIKTTPTRGGFVENVAMRRVKAKNVTASALNITYGYNGGAETKDVSTVPPTAISGVTLEDVWVGKAERALDIEGDGRLPVKGVSLNRFSVRRCKCPDIVKNAEVTEPHDVCIDKAEGALDIQSLIDEAAAHGGGRVVVPAGRHVVGQIDLKSNVELHLEKGALLEGKVGLENYRVTTLPYSEGTWSAVVSAIGVTNVAITGQGEIFGNGTAWPQPEDYGGNQEGRRPRGVFFADCRDVRLSDFTLRDSACWGVVLKCCENVDVRRLTIDSHANANNDGIDVEARNVVIADCDIDSGDDAVCLKSNNPDFVVENVLVSNVTARSHCNALKLGTASHGTMRNILFVDCWTDAPRRDYKDRRFGRNRWWYVNADRQKSYPGVGADEPSGHSSIAVENVDGGVVENITFRRIAANGSCTPIFIRAGTRRGRSCGTQPSDKRIFRNILLEDIEGASLSHVASSITGVEGCRVKGVTLRNVKIVCRGGGDTAAERTRPVPEVAGKYPDAHMFGCILPAYGLFVRHVDDLAIENTTFALAPDTTDSRDAVVLDDGGCFRE